jgi:hypothetical protein
MRLSRVRMLAATGMVVVASTIAGTAIAASAAPAKSSLPVLVQCTGAGQIKPSSTQQPACMLSSEWIPKLAWTSWTTTAFGSGTFAVNNCTPSASCGPSKYTKYPILIVLWKAVARPSHSGQKYFSKMTVIFTGSGRHFPTGHPVAQTFTLRA